MKNNLESLIKNKVVLGPMAGVTSLAYREFMKGFGVGLSFTEMVSDCGLIYENEKTLDYTKSSDIDRPVGIQLFGADEKNMQKAIILLQNLNISYDLIDINLGCPVNKVTHAGAGSFLLKDTSKLKQYMKVICETSSKPVTAKIRLGWDDKSINVIENVKALEEAGVSAITIHARTTKQLYSGKPNFECIRDIRKQMSVPLIISGDIYSVDDAKNALEITGADAVMVARGGVGNPFLVTQLNEMFNGKPISPKPDIKTNVSYLMKYVDLLINEKGEFIAMKILRGIAPKFFIGYENTKNIRREIAETIHTKSDLINILSKFNFI